MGYAPEPVADCQGLLLCGGGDIDPCFYGQVSKGSYPPDALRDWAEWKLIDYYLQRNRPILGICRGMQMLNVVLGGTILQHLPKERWQLHQGKQDVFHSISCSKDGVLSQFFVALNTVNSAHHQILETVSDELRVIAWAKDGSIEAVQGRDLPVLGVQFHPERMGNSPCKGLFDWFIQKVAQE